MTAAAETRAQQKRPEYPQGRSGQLVDKVSPTDLY